MFLKRAVARRMREVLRPRNIKRDSNGIDLRQTDTRGRMGSNASPIVAERPDAVTTPSARLDIVLRDAAAAPEILREWYRLEQTVEGCPLACSAEWTRIWLRHYGDLVPHRFAIGRHLGETCGIVLLTRGVGQKDGPFAIKTVHLGTAGEPEADNVCVEYNGICVQNDCRSEFVEELHGVLDRLDDWDEIRLDGFSAGEAVAFLSLDNAVRLREANCLYHDLRAARGANVRAIAQLGYSTRKTIRRNLRAYGALRTEWAEGVQQAESILADLVRLHQARWTAVGKPGCYASRRFLSFHRELVRQFVPSGRVALFRVWNGNDVVGCNQLLIDRNRVLSYQGGAAPYGGRLSPGLVVDYLCIEECRRRGYDAYDFLKGESHHKRRLSTDCTTLVWARRRRSRLKLVVVDTLRKLKQALDNSKTSKEQC